MKPLLPTLREKKRYIGFEIISEKSISFEAFNNSFNQELKNLIGTFGCAKAGSIVVKEKFQNNRGIIRSNVKFVDHIKSTFALMKSINNDNVLVRSLRVSGILKKAFPR